MSAREVPILFSAPMVQAILAGRKTQTRRTLHTDHFCRPELDTDRREWQIFDGDTVALRWRARWVPGDRLWVKETIIAAPALNILTGEPLDGHWQAEYAADKGWVVDERGFNLLPWWNPNRTTLSSIHMPRWASRITLLVTDIRVQRLREISEEDAMAEGMIWDPPTAEDAEWWSAYCAEHGEDPADRPMEGVWLAPGTRQGFGGTKEQRARLQFGCTAKQAYRWVWDAINGAGSWDQNPWVAAITFERIKP